MKRYIMLFWAIILFSCGKDGQLEKEISKIHIETSVDRFDLAFANATEGDIPYLKEKYPYLFPSQFPDSVWVAQLKDTFQIELNKEVTDAFPDFEREQEFSDLFRHIKYYFPEKKIPKIVTVTSYVDYNNNVVYTDSLLFVSLDTYLGKGHRFYAGIQEYFRNNFESEMMVSDAAGAFARTLIPRESKRSFLSKLIYYGKELYLKDLLIPFKSDAQKIGFTQEQYLWAEANESEIWRYFIENELLFSTDSKLDNRFINPAPFSKFYLELDAESPGRIGQYIGWQIIRAYMENNDVSLLQLLKSSSEEIFNKSRFKPRK